MAAYTEIDDAAIGRIADALAEITGTTDTRDLDTLSEQAAYLYRNRRVAYAALCVPSGAVTRDELVAIVRQET